VVGYDHEGSNFWSLQSSLMSAHPGPLLRALFGMVLNQPYDLVAMAPAPSESASQEGIHSLGSTWVT
jgi:hypothetical protein